MMLTMKNGEKQGSKQGIREAIRKKRDTMTNEEIERKSFEIAKNLAATAEYQKANAVLFYAAKGNEVQTRKLIEDALKTGKRVFLPISDVERKELEVSEIKDYDSDLKNGAFGIMEPKRKVAVDEKVIGAVIVPGVAFDREGHRLGYGHGYYDKLLHRLSRKNTDIRKIGLAYDFQVAARLPKEEHDQKMNMIVTESGVTKCS